MLASIFNAVRSSSALRFGILMLVALAVVWAFLVPSDARQSITILLAYYIGGPLLVGGVVGGSIGWLTLNKRAWGWTTGLVTVAGVGLLVWLR